MCSTLKCRPNSNTSSCVFVRGLGAASGTTCDMGKACIHGVCTKNIRAPRDDCIFGDDVVVNELVIDEPLPYTQLSCEETLTYLSSINLYGPAYCSQERFRQTCCKTCQSNQEKNITKTQSLLLIATITIRIRFDHLQRSVGKLPEVKVTLQSDFSREQ